MDQPADPPILYLPDSQVDADLDRQLRELLTLCFGGTGFRDKRYHNELPAHRWLVRAEDGALRAHIAAHDKCFGSAAGDLRCGGVAEVCVHPGFRGRGWVRRLLAAVHAWARREDIPFCFLVGQTEVYSSSGYRPVTNPLRYVDKNGRTVITPVENAMVRLMGGLPWPEGEIDLRGPRF